MEIADAIRAYMTENHLSQARLGKRWGVGQQTVSYWLNGKSFPDDQHCQLIAKDLKIPLPEILELRLQGATDPNRDYSRGGTSVTKRLREVERRLKAIEREMDSYRTMLAEAGEQALGLARALGRTPRQAR